MILRFGTIGVDRKHLTLSEQIEWVVDSLMWAFDTKMSKYDMRWHIYYNVLELKEIAKRARKREEATDESD